MSELPPSKESIDSPQELIAAFEEVGYPLSDKIRGYLLIYYYDTFVKITRYISEYYSGVGKEPIIKLSKKIDVDEAEKLFRRVKRRDLKNITYLIIKTILPDFQDSRLNHDTITYLPEFPDYYEISNCSDAALWFLKYLNNGLKKKKEK